MARGDEGRGRDGEGHENGGGRGQSVSSQSTTAGEEKKKRVAKATTGKWFPSTSRNSHLKNLTADGFHPRIEVLAWSNAGK